MKLSGLEARTEMRCKALLLDLRVRAQDVWLGHKLARVGCESNRAGECGDSGRTEDLVVYLGDKISLMPIKTRRAVVTK